MNTPFLKRTLPWMNSGLIGSQTYAIKLLEPQISQLTQIHINNPDDDINTLGQVAFQFDLAAAHDDLFALKVRRSTLKLKDDLPFTAFGVHKNAGIIVIAGGDISHLSIASVKNNGKQKLNKHHKQSHNNDLQLIALIKFLASQAASEDFNASQQRTDLPKSNGDEQ